MSIKITFYSMALLACLNLNAQTNPRYKVADTDSIIEVNTAYKPIHVMAPDLPKTYSLFGEKIPLEQWDVRERFDRELLVNTYMQGSTTYIIKLMSRWLPIDRKSVV